MITVWRLLTIPGVYVRSQWSFGTVVKSHLHKRLAPIPISHEVKIRAMSIGALGPHDVGGFKIDEPVIEIDSAQKLWEKQIHCTLALLAIRKLVSVDEMRRGIEQLPAMDQVSYYGKWARSLLLICLERGVLDDEDVAKFIQPPDGEVSDAFHVDQYVRVRRENFLTMWQKPHLRTPGYIFDVVGKIERYVGEFKSPEDLAYRKSDLRTQKLYRVRFLQRHIWPDYRGGPDDTVDVEIYAPWLRPSSETEYISQKFKKIVHDHDHNHHHHHHHGHDPHDHNHHHDHIHEEREVVEQRSVEQEGPETVDERIANGFVRALIAKKVFTEKDLQQAIENAEVKGTIMNGKKIVVKAWKDATFKAALLENANEAVRQLGLEASNPHAATKLVVVENDPTNHNVIVCTLCSCYPTGLLGPSPGWYKSRSYRARVVREPRRVLKEFGTELPNDVKLHVHDSTADCRYMVLPYPPHGFETMSEAELMDHVTRDMLIGVKR